jgi:hypothetical protein
VDAGKYCVQAEPNEAGEITAESASAAKSKAYEKASDELRQKASEFENTLRSQCSSDVAVSIAVGLQCYD